MAACLAMMRSAWVHVQGVCEVLVARVCVCARGFASTPSSAVQLSCAAAQARKPELMRVLVLSIDSVL